MTPIEIPQEIKDRWEEKCLMTSPIAPQVARYDDYKDGYIDGRTEQFQEQAAEVERLKKLVVETFVVYNQSEVTEAHLGAFKEKHGL